MTAFSLLTARERLQWRNALAEYLLRQSRTPEGEPLSPQKIEEQIRPLNLQIGLLIEDGARTPDAFVKLIDMNESTGVNHEIHKYNE